MGGNASCFWAWACMYTCVHVSMFVTHVAAPLRTLASRGADGALRAACVWHEGRDRRWKAEGWVFLEAAVRLRLCFCVRDKSRCTTQCAYVCCTTVLVHGVVVRNPWCEHFSELLTVCM